MKSILLSALTLLWVFFGYAQNVGVGTTAPETILHVAQTNTATDGIDGVFVNVQNTTTLAASGSLTGIRFRMDGVGTPVNSRYKGGIFFEKTGSFGVGSLHFLNNSAGNNNSVTMTDAKMTIASNGYVGIGTTLPNYKMHITGGDLFLQSSTGKFIFGYDGSNQWRYSTTGGGADMLMSSYNGTTETYRHYFAQNGNVGIGTYGPDSKLDVRGTARVFGCQASGPT